MIPGLFRDPASRALRLALDGLARRQEVIAQNIANVDTPQYRALAVRFEEALAQASAPRPAPATLALQTTHPDHRRRMASPETTPAPIQVVEAEPTRWRNDENTVDIDREMLLLAQTQLTYETVVQAMTKTLGWLRTAITEGRR
jgi:flagellar basal-body rod protein FlgB